MGKLISFDTKGIEFAMTALFIVIFIEQWKSQKKHTAALIGIFVSIFALVAFGPNRMVLPAMMLILIGLLGLKGKIDSGEISDAN